MRQIKVKPISENFSKMMGGATSSMRTSITQESKVGEFFFIDIENIIPYENQARVVFDDEEIQNLADSIKAHGIRQPLTVIASNKSPNKFEVISGERRLRASRLIGLDKLPCIILNEHEHADEIALIENIQREDLHPLELARSLKKLLDNNPELTQESLSKRLGLQRTNVVELLALTKLSFDVQELILEKNCRGRDNLRKIQSLKSDEEKTNFLNGIFQRSNKENLRSSKGSVIRVYLDDDMLKVQKKSVVKLSSHNRERLKEILSEILKEL